MLFLVSLRILFMFVLRLLYLLVIRNEQEHTAIVLVDISSTNYCRCIDCHLTHVNHTYSIFALFPFVRDILALVVLLEIGICDLSIKYWRQVRNLACGLHVIRKVNTFIPLSID